MNDKRCTGCREYLPLTSFRQQPGGKDGLRACCINCQSAYGREHYQKNKVRLERERRARKAKVTA